MSPSSPSVPSRGAGPGRGTPSSSIRALELFTMCGLAVAQPVYSVISSNVAELVQRRVTGLDVVVFALVVLLTPPALLWAAEAVIGRIAANRQLLAHTVLLSALFGVFLMQLTSNTDGAASWLVLALGIGAAVIFGRLYRSAPPVRTWLRYLAVAPVLFLVSFLVLSPVRRVAFASVPAAAAADDGADRPDVVVVVLDELPELSLLTPDGSIDAAQYPNIARLAGTSTWYRNTTTSSSWTMLAVPSLLTGTYANPDAAPIAADHPHSLFTMFGGTYDLNVWETVTRVCPIDLCPDRVDPPPASERVVSLLAMAGTVLRQRTSPFEEPDVRLQVEGIGQAHDRVALFRDFVDSVQPADRPSLHLVHLTLPHQPWTLLPSTATHNGPEVPSGLWDGMHWPDEATAAFAQQAHHLSLAAADTLLGELLDDLEASGMFDESVIVLAADHGTALTPQRPFRAITADTVDQIAYPPLFIKAPGQTDAAVSDIPAQTVDIVPTIAALTGMPLPWPVDGLSLLDEDAVDARGAHRYRPVWLDELSPDESGFAELESSTFAERVERNRALLEAVAGPTELYRLGDAPDLVGRAVADLPVADGPRLAGTIGEPGAQRSVSPFLPVPAYVVARFDQRPGGLLALAVDGTVVVTGGFADAAPYWFWGIVPEASLDGATAHRFELFEIVEQNGATALRPVSLQQPG